MSFLDSMNIGATGLRAQEIRMNVVSNNIANIDTTRTPQGGPYKRKDVVFVATDYDDRTLLVSDKGLLNKDDGSFILPKGVQVIDVVDDRNATKMVYKPGHPDANKQGYVSMPNIDAVVEMINMIGATRAYEANLKTISSARDMVLKTLNIGM